MGRWTDFIGSTVNRAVADKLVFRLKNDASVKRIKL